MPEYESEQEAMTDLVREFPAVPRRIIQRILHAYLETTHDLSHAARATRIRIDDALHS
jgi:hypothetical protein